MPNNFKPRQFDFSVGPSRMIWTLNQIQSEVSVENEKENEKEFTKVYER